MNENVDRFNIFFLISKFELWFGKIVAEHNFEIISGVTKFETTELLKTCWCEIVMFCISFV